MSDLQPLVPPAPDVAQQTIERLTSRIQVLESQIKGLRWAFPGFAILVAALLVMQVNKPSTLDVKYVVAESFGVKNPKGNAVVRLGTTSDGSPNLAFFDAEQRIRLMVGLRANGGPSVSLIDPQQVARAVLSLNDQFDPSLTLFNAEKLPRTVLGTDGGDNANSGHLIMYGTAGGLDLAASNGRVRWNPRDGAPVDVLPVKP
jgi:hypothetical protein